MRERWRWIGSGFACAALIAACGDQAPPGLNASADGRTGIGGRSCATPGSTGCPCSQAGQTAACGDVVTTNGSYVTCSMGDSTCDGHAWGPCVGNRIVDKSLAGRSLASDGLRIESTSAPCSNVCDPNPDCSGITGASSDVDASGLSVTDGGIVLLGADAPSGSGLCTGLQCKVVSCGGDGGTSTTIAGIVYDPAGNNPLYNATVYIPVDPTGTLPAFTSGATCDQCGGASALNAVALATTSTDGSFTLKNVPSGSNIPIVVQMGKWRRELLLKTVTSCIANSVTGNCTATDPSMCTLRLPRNKYDGYNAADGKYDRADLPQMALVTGSADPLECMLLKAGIDPSEFSSYDANASARIHFFSSPNAPGTTLDPSYGSNKTGDVLWLDNGDPQPNAPTAPHYDFYDVVLLPCEGASIDKEPLYVTNGGGEPYKNLIKYADLGGRVFTTHFGYVWMEYPSLYNYVAGPDNWSSVASWASQTGTTYTQDPLPATIVQTFAKGAAFAQWLQNVGATSTLGQLYLHQARQDLTTVGASSQAWMTATDSNPPWGFTGNFDPHFTFNTPYAAAAANQCGRVVYSDFHVSASALVDPFSGGQCVTNADCGFTLTCVGATQGSAGTCSEPCATNADCADQTYSCNGAVSGTCGARACTSSTKKGKTTYTCSIGTCNAAHTACSCTSDSQCPGGKCIDQGQCIFGSCSGTGTPDGASCASTGNTCFTSSQCGKVETCSGSPKLGACSKACTSNTQCTGGETCSGGFCQGCVSNANCKDQTYAVSCNGTVPATPGTCCFPKTPPNPPIPPNQANPPDTNNCNVADSQDFPEACIQTPLSAQEKALEFMFFDLTACVTPDTAAPPPPAVRLVAQTFPLDFTGTCPAGTKVQWRELDWQASFPNPANGSTIGFAAQTGPAGADAASLLPSTPLPLVNAATNTALPNYDIVLLDTSPGGTGKFTTASPPLLSQAALRIWVTINPTSDGLASPTLISWKVQYDCPPAE